MFNKAKIYINLYECEVMGNRTLHHDVNNKLTFALKLQYLKLPSIAHLATRPGVKLVPTYLSRELVTLKVSCGCVSPEDTLTTGETLVGNQIQSNMWLNIFYSFIASIHIYVYYEKARQRDNRDCQYATPAPLAQVNCPTVPAEIRTNSLWV